MSDQLQNATLTTTTGTRAGRRASHLLAVAVLLMGGALITYGTSAMISIAALPVAMGLSVTLLVDYAVRTPDENGLSAFGWICITFFASLVAVAMLMSMWAGIPATAPRTEILPSQYARISASLDASPDAETRRRRSLILAANSHVGWIDQRDYRTYFDQVDTDSVDRVLGRARR